jgi:hypothetical protein
MWQSLAKQGGSAAGAVFTKGQMCFVDVFLPFLFGLKGGNNR